MTFSTNVPNSGQSPGVFPAPANINFSRLQTIIAGDHVFNDTAQVTDGVHNQVTMVARSTPGSLPAGTNGILYNKITGSTGELWYYNGTTDIQITPLTSEAPLNLTGMTPGTVAQNFVYLVKTFTGNYAGSGFVFLAGNYTYYSFYRYFGNIVVKSLASANPTAVPPIMTIVGNALNVINKDPNPQQVFFSFQITEF